MLALVAEVKEVTKVVGLLIVVNLVALLWCHSLDLRPLGRLVAWLGTPSIDTMNRLFLVEESLCQLVEDF